MSYIISDNDFVTLRNKIYNDMSFSTIRTDVLNILSRVRKEDEGSGDIKLQAVPEPLYMIGDKVVSVLSGATYIVTNIIGYTNPIQWKYDLESTKSPLISCRLSEDMIEEDQR